MVTSISQVTWPLFGQLDISDENFEPRPVVPRKSACFSAARLTVNGPPLRSTHCMALALAFASTGSEPS